MPARAKKQKDEGSEVAELSNEDAGGQLRIPGTERKVIKALVQFAERRENTKAQHKLLTAELKEQNDVEGPMLFEKYKEHFEETDDSWIYVAGGIEIDMVKGDLKVKTKTLSDDE